MDNLLLRLSRRGALALSLLIVAGSLMLSGCSSAPSAVDEEIISKVKSQFRESLLPIQAFKPAYVAVHDDPSYYRTKQRLRKTHSDINQDADVCTFLCRKIGNTSTRNLTENEFQIQSIVKNVVIETDLKLVGVKVVDTNGKEGITTAKAEMETHAHRTGERLAKSHITYKVKQLESGRRKVEISSWVYDSLSDLPEIVKTAM